MQIKILSINDTFGMKLQDTCTGTLAVYGMYIGHSGMKVNQVYWKPPKIYPQKHCGLMYKIFVQNKFFYSFKFYTQAKSNALTLSEKKF